MTGNSTGLNLPTHSKEAEMLPSPLGPCQLTGRIAGPDPPVEADYNLNNLLHAQTAEGWAVDAVVVQAGRGRPAQSPSADSLLLELHCTATQLVSTAQVTGAGRACLSIQAAGVASPHEAEASHMF